MDTDRARTFLEIVRSGSFQKAAERLHVTQTTVVLIATTGEWTRRKVPDPAAARQIATTLGIPVYDVQLTGYPQRMRDWNARRRQIGRASCRERV